MVIKLNIPFNKPYITGREKEYILKSLNNGKTCGDGKFTKEVNRFMMEKFNAYKALMTTSCTHAIELGSMLIDLKPGDEVIVPSYTFVSTVNPILLRGATPVFAEIREDTLNIDPDDIERKITKNTKAIFPVHYAGIACDMDRIMEIAKEHNLYVVEDAAQGVNAKYKGQFLGTIGDIGCYSFHETKNYSSGEGGALIINHDNIEFAQMAEIIREKGTNRSKFIRGEIDKYTWVNVGSSYLPSDILSAYLLAQFEAIDEINNKRKTVFDSYYKGLTKLQERGKLRLPIIPKYAETNYHMFYILLNTNGERNNLMDFLKTKGIQSVFHYIPLHSSPIGVSLGYKSEDLPKTEELSGRLLRLPMYAELGQDEISYIIKNIEIYFESNK